MLTLALPKGRLLDAVIELFHARAMAAAAALRGAGRALVCEAEGLSMLLLKDADVPVYVEQGVADCGIGGLDQVLERGADVLRLLRLPFGHCRLCLIARDGSPPPEEGRPLLIATKFPSLVTRLAAERGHAVRVIPLAGSVELAARLGLADFVVDLVETGRTLRENGLHPVEEWLRVAPYLIANRAASYVMRDELRALRRTLSGGPRRGPHVTDGARGSEGGESGAASGFAGAATGAQGARPRGSGRGAAGPPRRNGGGR